MSVQIDNIKVTPNASISIDGSKFVITLQNYDGGPDVLKGSFGIHGDWTIDDLIEAIQCLKDIQKAIDL